MAIAFRGAAQVMNTSGSALSVQVPMPAGLAVGDRVVVSIGFGAASPTFTDPAGWTKLGEILTGTQLKTAVYYRDVVGGEASTYTWSSSNAGRSHGYALAYSGCDLAVQPIALAAVDTDVASLATPAVQLTEGDWLVTFGAGRQNPGTDAAKTWTNSDPADVERFDLYTAVTGTTPKYTAAAYDSGRALAAGSAQRTLTCSPAPSQMAAWAVRLAAPAVVTAPTAANPWSYAGVPQRA